MPIKIGQLPDAGPITGTELLEVSQGGSSKKIQHASLIGPTGATGGAGPTGASGPTGATGATGAPGSGDLTYVHNQLAASATWTINHNLGKYPSVTIVDSAGTIVEGNITHTDANTSVATFSAVFGGKAYCN